MDGLPVWSVAASWKWVRSSDQRPTKGASHKSVHEQHKWQVHTDKCMPVCVAFCPVHPVGIVV